MAHLRVSYVAKINLILNGQHPSIYLREPDPRKRFFNGKWLGIGLLSPCILNPMQPMKSENPTLGLGPYLSWYWIML